MEIKSTSDIENHHIFALIVGGSGSGKTTLAKTLDNEGTLILSAESGLLSIKDVAIDYVEVNNMAALVDTYKTLKAGTKYKNIFIDSLTEIGEVLFSELKPEFSKSQSFGLYDKYSEKITSILKAFRDLTDYNVFITALDKMQAKDLTEIVSIDLVQKSLAKKIPAFFDEVFYLVNAQNDDGTTKRAISTDNTLVEFAKDRSGKLDKFERPDLGLITKKILGEN